MNAAAGARAQRAGTVPAVDRGPAERHRALVRARCALSVVQAQHRQALALALADGTGARERAAAHAEVRRLVTVGVALRGRALALQAAERAPAQPQDSHRPRRREAGHPSPRRHIARLTQTPAARAGGDD